MDGPLDNVTCGKVLQDIKQHFSLHFYLTDYITDFGICGFHKNTKI